MSHREGARSPRRLAVLLHGVGATPESLAPVGHALFGSDPDTAWVLLGGPEPFDGGAGRQWFSIAGVTSENRATRVAAALPSLAESISAIAEREGVAPASLTIVGFSQGAIMTLALASSGYPFGQALALSGRLANEVRPAWPASPAVFLSHGLGDPVIPASESERASRLLAEQGYRVTFLPLPQLGHATSPGQLLRLREIMNSSRQGAGLMSEDVPSGHGR